MCSSDLGHARGHLHTGLAVGGCHGDLAAEGQFIKAEGQFGPQLVAIQSPDRMGVQLEIEVEISAAAGAGLQVALALEPQATAGLDPGRDAHLHLFLIDRQGALAAPEGIGVAELQGGFGIEVDGAAAAAPGKAPTRKTAPWKTATGEAGTEATGKIGRASCRERV